MPRPDAPRYDVPLGITAGVVALLVALFLPLAHRTAAWPTELPHLSYDERAVTLDHLRDLALAPPPATREVMRAWDAWSRAAAASDLTRSRDARQRFADVLNAATARARDPAVALRARATERFLDGLDDLDAPLTVVARRHGLAGPESSWYASRAARIAWFAMRWERNAAPATDDGHVEPFHDTLLRVPRSYQRAFASWALDARCHELIGPTVSRALTATDVRSCAAFRADLVPVARGVDPRYPDEESLAAVDVFLALGLRRVGRPSPDAPVTVVDDSGRAGALAESQSALARAQERYARMLERAPSRRIERHFMAVVAELGGDDPGDETGP